MKKQIALASALLLTVGASLAACSPTGGASDSSVTLKMIQSVSTPERTKVITSLLTQFEEENEGITVELISPPRDNADTKIATMLQAKQPLDVLEVRDQTVSQFVNNSAIENLTAYVEEWPGYSTLTDAAKTAATSVEDTPYYIPYGLYPRALFYRKDLFTAAGLTPPTTWDELYEVAKELTDPDKNQYGYAYRGGNGADIYLTTEILAHVGQSVNPQDSMFQENGETIFTSPEAVKGYELFNKLYADASPKDSLNWSFSETVDSFKSGVTAMLVNDTEVVGILSSELSSDLWGTSPMPVGPSGAAPRYVGAAGWGMTSYSEHKDEAWKLIQFLSDNTQNLEFDKVTGLMPIHADAAEDEFFNSGAYEAFVKMDSMPDVHIVVRDPSGYAGYAEFRQQQTADNQSVILGQKTVDEALKAWDAYWLAQKK